jgi:uncharacterized membrane protein required for colicin V production
MSNTQSNAQMNLAACRSESQEAFQRVLIALLVFAGVTAISLLMPRALPGEMSGSELRSHAILPCATCPPPEQIVSAGLAVGGEQWFLNVKFAAPPVASRVAISLDGAPGTLQLQRAGAAWSLARPVPPGFPRVLHIDQRDDRLVVTLEPAATVSGFFVSTGSGDRLPSSGFAPPTYPAAAHFNETDFVLLLILAATAAYGFSRGFAVEIADLAAMVLSLTVAALIYRPLASVFEHITGSKTAGPVLGSGVLVVGLALGGMFVVRKFFSQRAEACLSLPAQWNGVLGGTAGCLRQLPVMAMLLAAGMNLAALHWAANSMQSSLLGSALMRAWRTPFSGM